MEQISPEEIQTLIIAEITGDISDQERAYLHRIIADNEQARHLYDDMHKFLNDVAVVQSKNELGSRIKLEDMMLPVSPRRSKRMLRIGLSVAAMVVVLVGIYISIKPKETNVTELTSTKRKVVNLVMADGKVINLDKQDTAWRAGTIALNNKNNTLTYSAVAGENTGKGIINVPAGRFYQLVLSDGSKVTLNSATKIEFPFVFTGDTRELSIDGEAYLDIVKSNKPFLVHLPTSTVKVLGTSFNVNTYDKEEKVSLVTGKVRFETLKEKITLEPGNEVSSVNGKSLAVTPFNQEEVLSWIDGIYVFHDNTLQDVAKVVDRWYGVQLLLSEQVRNKHFYGFLDRKQPIQQFLEKLKFVNEVEYHIEGNVIHIK
jgi:ferric-dicitrate binding protein FerR (iron transport regulator)